MWVPILIGTFVTVAIMATGSAAVYAFMRMIEEQKDLNFSWKSCKTE